jgi:hypothetical protein
MLRILNMESSKFPGIVLFPTGFAPKGTLHGDKGGATSPAALGAVGVGMGVGGGGSLKTCGRIENSGARHLEELGCIRPHRVWQALLVEGSKSLVLISANCSLMCSARVLGSAEELRGEGEQEGWKDIMGKSTMVVVRDQKGMSMLPLQIPTLACSFVSLWLLPLSIYLLLDISEYLRLCSTANEKEGEFPLDLISQLLGLTHML